MNRQVILKNNALFISCISKINGVLVENVEDLDIVMPMYNLLEYSENYSKTSGSLWNYYRDELTDETNDDNGPNKNVIYSKSFKYKTSITGSTYNVPTRITGADGNPVSNSNYDRNKRGTKEVEMAVPLKHLRNFWNGLNMLLVNCEVSRSKRTIKWNKYRSEMSYQTKNNNLNYLINPTFTDVNRLLVLTFENEDDRTSFSKYYLPKVEIKYFNVLIDGKPFFEIPVKNKEQAYEAIIEMSKNNDCTTGNLLDYEYFKDHCKLIAIIN